MFGTIRSDIEEGVLFETGSGKWLELVPGNARFHSSRDKVTPVDKAVFDDPKEKAFLLGHHNVDWYSSTIEWQPIAWTPSFGR